MDQDRKAAQDRERREFVKTHFGPENPLPSEVDEMKRQKIDATSKMICDQI